MPQNFSTIQPESSQQLDSLRKRIEHRPGQTEEEIVKEMARESERQGLQAEDEQFTQELHDEPGVKQSPKAQAAAAHAPAKSQFLIEIENILADGLGDIYNNMEIQLKAEFKTRGEETAAKIELLLSQAKVKIKKIVILLKAWLKMIPSINKYFLEQEAKIKADKLIALGAGH